MHPSREAGAARLGSIVAAALLLSAVAPLASAQPSRDAVFFLYNEGKALMEARRFSEACARFEKAKHLDATAINLLLRLGDCYEKLGRTATAWAQFKRVAAIAAAARDPRAAAAEARARALEPKLSRLVIHLPPLSDARGLEVRRNGVVVPRAELGMDTPIDPGVYAIEATAPGKKPWIATEEVAPNGARVDVTVPPLDDAAGAQAIAAALPAEPNRATRAEPSGLGAQAAIGIAVSAAGLVGLGVGVAFGVRAASKSADANDSHCDARDHCDAPGLALRDDARRAGTLAAVAFVAGAALAAGGAALIITSRISAKKKAVARVEVLGAPAPGGAAFVLRGRF